MRLRLALVVGCLAGCLDPEPGDPCAEQEDCGSDLRCVALDVEGGGVCQGPDALDPSSLMQYEPAAVDIGD